MLLNLATPPANFGLRWQVCILLSQQWCSAAKDHCQHCCHPKNGYSKYFQAHVAAADRMYHGWFYVPCQSLSSDERLRVTTVQEYTTASTTTRSLTSYSHVAGSIEIAIIVKKLRHPDFQSLELAGRVGVGVLIFNSTSHTLRLGFYDIATLTQA